MCLLLLLGVLFFGCCLFIKKWCVLGHHFISYMYSSLFSHSFPHRYLLTLSSTLISPLPLLYLLLIFFFHFPPPLPSPPLYLRLTLPGGPLASSPTASATSSTKKKNQSSRSPSQSPPPCQTSEKPLSSSHLTFSLSPTHAHRQPPRLLPHRIRHIQHKQINPSHPPNHPLFIKGQRKPILRLMPL